MHMRTPRIALCEFAVFSAAHIFRRLTVALSVMKSALFSVLNSFLFFRISKSSSRVPTPVIYLICFRQRAFAVAVLGNYVLESVEDSIGRDMWKRGTKRERW